MHAVGSKFYQNVYSRWKDRRPTWWPFDDFSCRDLNNCNKADLEGLGKTLLQRRIDRLVQLFLCLQYIVAPSIQQCHAAVAAGNDLCLPSQVLCTHGMYVHKGSVMQQASGAERQQQHVAACDGRKHPSELRPKHRQEDEDSDQQVSAWSIHCSSNLACTMLHYAVQHQFLRTTPDIY